MNSNYPYISDNDLLSSLPDPDHQKMSSLMELVSLEFKDTICPAGTRLDYAYFPISGMLSIVYVLENGECGEVGIIGKEGFIGIPILLGGEIMPYEIVVQGEGKALRLPVQQLKLFFDESVSLRNNLLHYMQAFMTQISQTAVCNRHHSIEKRLCRWLLLSLDRVPKNELIMTQDLIAIMLGVRREGVAYAAKILQNEGIIEYSRGKILVLDRDKIEKRCCECYKTVKSEFLRLFPK